MNLKKHTHTHFHLHKAHEKVKIIYRDYCYFIVYCDNRNICHVRSLLSQRRLFTVNRGTMLNNQRKDTNCYYKVGGSDLLRNIFFILKNKNKTYNNILLACMLPYHAWILENHVTTGDHMHTPTSCDILDNSVLSSLWC